MFDAPTDVAIPGAAEGPDGVETRRGAWAAPSAKLPTFEPRGDRVRAAGRLFDPSTAEALRAPGYIE